MFKNLWNSIKSKLGLTEDAPVPMQADGYHRDTDAAYTQAKYCHNGLLDESGLSVKEIEDCWRCDDVNKAPTAPAASEDYVNLPITETLSSLQEAADAGMLKMSPAEPINIVSSWEAKPKKARSKKNQIDVEITSTSTEVKIPKKKPSKSKSSKSSKKSKGSKSSKKGKKKN